MNITMLATKIGVEDGFTVREYEEGHTYEIADGLASGFLRDRVAYPAGNLERAYEIRREQLHRAKIETEFPFFRKNAELIEHLDAECHRLGCLLADETIESPLLDLLRAIVVFPTSEQMERWRDPVTNPATWEAKGEPL